MRSGLDENIETEEILMDSKRLKESPGSEREKLEKPIKENVLRLFFVLTAIILILLFVRGFYLQIVKGSYWRILAEENRIRSYPISPLRGIIYDKNRISLATNVPSLDLMVIPLDLIQKSDYKEILFKISQILGIAESELKQKINKNPNLSYPIVISENLPRDKAILLEAELNDVAGIKIQKNSRRFYENGQIFAHLLGYLAKVTPEEVSQKKYFLDDYIGRTGIEETYEDILRGTYGEELAEIDSSGKTVKTLATKEPVNGNDVVLSIDAELQKTLYSSLKSKLNTLSTSRAAAVAIDPRDGKLLALVSLPSFDSNKFVQGESGYVQKIFQDKNQPLFNRVVSGTYPPGSTIKPMIAAAALKENVINQNKTISCPGYINLLDKYGRSVYWTFADWKAHGIVDMIKAIAESCDVYFYTIGGGYGNIEGLGIERIKKYLEIFGWGQKTGIDLPGEKTGFLPSPQWKEETKNEEWFVGDTYNASIGQGDITMSLLQLTSAIGAIANNGKLYQPQSIQSAQPKLIRENFIESEYLETVRKGMREVIVSGSGKLLNDLPVSSAGKTGTAQTAKNKSPHAWFTVFAPYENPEIVLTILIENGGEGSSTAAPVAKEVLNWYFTR